jgi:hypothetical protein
MSCHVVQAHKHEILRKAEASHTIPLHEVRALQQMSFLREVKRRLFVVTVHCHGHLLYAAVQVSNLRSAPAHCSLLRMWVRLARERAMQTGLHFLKVLSLT